jgi:hypothetical protein
VNQGFKVFLLQEETRDVLIYSTNIWGALYYMSCTGLGSGKVVKKLHLQKELPLLPKYLFTCLNAPKSSKIRKEVKDG